ncbi:hypothetical protein D7D52_02840 [Nocardia yunnanensis]|uniref:Uncharacterized protein n=1 Tax=Nocardia yunnanensis TaxID=2382165 RepID=A0A386Z920_9NOCA|nr:hypothetical protein [Nocardia yunnanensis]AYF72979.1 hypothetical protein D7D52_02840 [Nocardia yunnanensis]
MFAIIAAVLFAIGLILDLADRTTGVGADAFVIAGLLCLALHLAGVAERLNRGQFGSRRPLFGRRRR